MKFEIKWNLMLNSYAIHGSVIQFFQNGGAVHFENPLLPPGARIIKWDSRSAYQSHRTFLQLPLLERGEQYQIKACLNVIPEGSVAIKFCTYNREGQVLEVQLLPSSGGEVTYSVGATCYSIELINTQIEQLNFECLWLIK